MTQDSTAGLAAAVSPFVFSANLHLKASLNSNLTFHAHLTPAVGKFARQTLTRTHTHTQMNISAENPFILLTHSRLVPLPGRSCSGSNTSSTIGQVQSRGHEAVGGNEYKVCKYI